MATDPNMVQSEQHQNGLTSSILTVKMIMQGKEVGSIIGKKGDNIKKFREESGAKINISDGSCPERIVTITGSSESINKAFTMICTKFEEDLQNTPTVPKPPVTLRLVVPASQCGSLIGKGGSKIKEIREGTGASIQVASEMLPNSTERAVTISGTADAIILCMRYICNIMLESPPKGATIPYRPKPVVPPMIFAGGQAYTIQGQIAVPHQPELTKMPPIGLGQPVPLIPTTHPTIIPMSNLSGMPAYHLPRQAAPAIQNTQQTHEMNIPNDLIGCIIGRGGQKINEIRQISGATIKISNSEEGASERKVTITGTAETINLAQYLINTSMELHKSLTLDPNSPPTSTSLTSVQSQPQPQPHLGIPLTTGMMKPMPYMGLNLGMLDAATAAAAAAAAATNNNTNANKSALATKLRVGVSALREHPKFAPY